MFSALTAAGAPGPTTLGAQRSPHPPRRVPKQARPPGLAMAPQGARNRGDTNDPIIVATRRPNAARARFVSKPTSGTDENPRTNEGVGIVISVPPPVDRALPRLTETKRCCVPTRAQSRRRRSMGYARTGVPPRQRGPVALAGRFPPPPMRAWLEQPHGRHHKAPPQPCALTTTSTSARSFAPSLLSREQSRTGNSNSSRRCRRRCCAVAAACAGKARRARVVGSVGSSTDRRNNRCDP